MKTGQIRKTIMVWSCHNGNHSHLSRNSAERCIHHHDKVKIITAVSHAAKLRRLKMVAMRASGVTYASIGAEMGISGVRVSYIIRQESMRAARVTTNGEDPFEYLSTRTINCLKAADIRTMHELKQALADGTLKDIPNMGKKSIISVQLFIDQLENDKE